MGIFDKIVSKIGVTNQEDQFVQLIRARDDGEEWARKELNRLWESNEPNLLQRIDSARVKIYSQRAYNGDKEAQLIVGRALASTNNQESFRLLKTLADEGNVDAMKSIAIEYTEFGGYGDNASEYFQWNLKAAKADDAEAQATIGLEYICTGDYNSAFDWYKKSAEQGYFKGFIGLGKCYDHFYSNEKEELRSKNEKMKAEREEYYVALIEDTYINALNASENDEQFGEACCEIGKLYRDSALYVSQDLNDAERAVYFLYVSYIIEPMRSYALKYFQELVQQFNLDINENMINGDLEYLEKWAISKGIR